MKHRLISVLIAIAMLPTVCPAQTAPDSRELKVLTDTLNARVKRYFNVSNRFSLKEAKMEGGCLNLQFDEKLGGFSWHDSDIIWFRAQIDKQLKIEKRDFSVDRILIKDIPIEEYSVPPIGNKGRPSRDYRYRFRDPRMSASNRFVNRVGGRRFKGGMSDRYIALWQSHGYVYAPAADHWSWQRAVLHRTVEDMYTQSYVLPFLIPMLENAGAYVMTPRERDIQRGESICDNDPQFPDERTPGMRTCGSYSETGRWEGTASGFADSKPVYTLSDNPFGSGTSRRADCAQEPDATARWTPEIPHRGRYAVYVSYQSSTHSSTAAHYTVRHLGGETEYTVNQRRGGGTWIYLGTFEFAPGTDCWVELDNRGQKGMTVSADAVRFGGGMGKVERSGMLSGMPAYAEGALYSMVWAGLDSTRFNMWDTDYTRDYAARGVWTRWMRSEKNIPFDMSLAFHSDAGTTPNDSIIGTLAIYTLMNENERMFTANKNQDRMASRMLCDYVQTQIVDDVGKDFEPMWRRRDIRDKSYSESRTTDVPAMLLELLSHQNFADMKYGLDPAFRFTVSRSVYKGMLKFLSELYGCPYVVQPLPVHGFSAMTDSTGVRLEWQPTVDEKEATAVPGHYLVQTRIDDGVFDEGVEVDSCSMRVELPAGHVVSWRVIAFNDGGYSFPSEILSAGRPCSDNGRKVLIVNNFDRVSAPTWAESPGYAGFDGRIDGGVPWNYDISYVGENYEFRRSLKWKSDDNSGFGASFSDKAGSIIAGNTFDYPAVHGRALLELGIAFESCSREAFENASARSSTAGMLDLVCGKQVTTKMGSGRVGARYEVFPFKLREALSAWVGRGLSVFISGADIATDVWDTVYPTGKEPDAQVCDFVEKVLGYTYASSFGTNTGRLEWVRKPFHRTVPEPVQFYNKPNEESYCVECPDAITPSDRNGRVWMRYNSTGRPAGVVYSPDGGSYKVVSLGVPLETVRTAEDRLSIMKYALQACRMMD